MFRTAIRAGLALALLASASGAATAATCEEISDRGETYAVCEIDAGEDLRLFLNGRDGKPYGSFERLSAALKATGKRLVFAMNGGMYHPDRRPVGLYVENGSQIAGLVTRAGPGNFGLLPNGVFCIEDDRFRVVESRAYEAEQPSCRFASQSGPMLVIGGALHPKFLKDSDSRNIRNGVGVSADGRRAWLVISDRPVTFYTFATLFRDRLKTPNALYLDGRISRLYAPELGRADPGRPMGPILGLVAGG
ncbi:phosphodiester glycosidase family protein [Frigidibacter sp. ROC022]|uniref:phosphodiester glycosidase family protein n=1 Tax=Frigidibacter sp. ROC022 TaxID=2971796 RepID=UPI00215A1C24|nr:phosphodiester glycosidase family protein [Frigidibacter sp. ROC022]MCR8725905.1 phosphodiester glycosidase family protein [Frigidibacter sp. ROC022]